MSIEYLVPSVYISSFQKKGFRQFRISPVSCMEEGRLAILGRNMVG
jgi:hypothetical protein